MSEGSDTSSSKMEETVGLTIDFDETELAMLEDPNRTPAYGWFVSLALSQKSEGASLPGRKPVPSIRRLTSGLDQKTRHMKSCVSLEASSSLVLTPAKSFIFDHLPTMDFCDFPELKRLHGAMQ